MTLVAPKRFGPVSGSALQPHQRWGGEAGGNYHFFQRMGSSHSNAGREGEGGSGNRLLLFLFGKGGDNHYCFQRMGTSHTNPGREGKEGKGSRLLLLFFFFGEGGGQDNH